MRLRRCSKIFLIINLFIIHSLHTSSNNHFFEGDFLFVFLRILLWGSLHSPGDLCLHMITNRPYFLLVFLFAFPKNLIHLLFQLIKIISLNQFFYMFDILNNSGLRILGCIEWYKTCFNRIFINSLLYYNISHGKPFQILYFLYSVNYILSFSRNKFGILFEPQLYPWNYFKSDFNFASPILMQCKWSNPLN